MRQGGDGKIGLEANVPHWRSQFLRSEKGKKGKNVALAFYQHFCGAHANLIDGQMGKQTLKGLWWESLAAFSHTYTHTHICTYIRIVRLNYCQQKMVRLRMRRGSGDKRGWICSTWWTLVMAVHERERWSLKCAPGEERKVIGLWEDGKRRKLL